MTDATLVFFELSLPCTVTRVPLVRSGRHGIPVRTGLCVALTFTCVTLSLPATPIKFSGHPLPVLVQAVANVFQLSFDGIRESLVGARLQQAAGGIQRLPQSRVGLHPQFPAVRIGLDRRQVGSELLRPHLKEAPLPRQGILLLFLVQLLQSLFFLLDLPLRIVGEGVVRPLAPWHLVFVAVPKIVFAHVCHV
ncbi:hypothetical protein WKI68_30160 [Streptomyces sp. MS1.HAVA.3]|uniref:Uncharacterized protein n=1 Tax=Streptomyces caledonius TaxID=3134107 RepID=A0ABU8UB97_9ACTN